MAGEQRQRNPGDEAPPGSLGTGEAICRKCRGTGHVEGHDCPDCGGTGRITEGVGGA
jgi:DnaJ-class molecular chaperone